MSEALLAAFDHQISWCGKLGSPFTAELLRLLKHDFGSGGVTASLLDGWGHDPIADAVTIRLVGALHALALDRAELDLADLYPPPRSHSSEQLRTAVLRTLDRQHSFVSRFLTFPPQTNEVGRSAILLGGFLTIAGETGLPLQMLEIGASAGLNGQWDRFSYTIDGTPWGDPHSPVQLAPVWHGGRPPLAAPLRVRSRAACDAAPLDILDDRQALRLRAYVWADQTERLARLDAAIALARAHPLPVAAEPAETWLPQRLATMESGCTTVLYHSVMWQYMTEEARSGIGNAIHSTGSRATRAAPFAWLRFEPPADGGPMELTLTVWPGGQPRKLAIAHPHGANVTWLTR